MPYENFVLPLSHDEVVHEKGALLGKMPGDEWQKFANMRLLFGYMYAQPGKKLLFMGGEIGQWNEWSHEASLDWSLLAYPLHSGIQRWIGDLNRLYREEPAFYELDFHPDGFEWIDCGDSQGSVLNLIRKGSSTEDILLIALNFTPVPRFNYSVGAPRGGHWTEILNSDSQEYGGSGLGNLGGADAFSTPFHGRPNSLKLTLPPLGAVFLKSEKSGR